LSMLPSILNKASEGFNLEKKTELSPDEKSITALIKMMLDMEETNSRILDIRHQLDMQDVESILADEITKYQRIIHNHNVTLQHLPTMIRCVNDEVKIRNNEIARLGYSTNVHDHQQMHHLRAQINDCIDQLNNFKNLIPESKKQITILEGQISA